MRGAARVPGRRRVGIALLLFLTSCGDGEGPTGPDPTEIAEILIAASGLPVLAVGETLQLQAAAYNGLGNPVAGSLIEWQSLLESVALVDAAGVVSGVGEGSAEITATAGGRTGTIMVSVDPAPVPAPPVNLTGTPASDTRIELTWANGADPATEIRIERAADAPSAPGAVEGEGAFQEIASVESHVTAYADSALDPATTYHYRLRACTPFACSEYTEAEAASTYATLSVSTAILPSGVAHARYEGLLEAVGGDGGHLWSLASGLLPEGLVLSESGAVSGTPTQAGFSPFTARVESGDGQVATQEFEFVVHPSMHVATTALPGGEVGLPYDQELVASGGTAPHVWALSGGDLPPGLDLDPATGRIQGTPDVSGTFDFRVTVTDAGTQGGEQELAIDVLPGAVTILTGSLPGGEEGVSYEQALSAVGGDGVSYSWMVAEGELPPGLFLHPISGFLSGVPSQAGDYPFTVRVESGGRWAETVLSIAVADLPPVPVVISTRALVGAYLGSPYSSWIAAQGGNGQEYQYSVSGGSLPAGLSLHPETGAITGTPSASGTSGFTIEVESGGVLAAVHLNITVSTNPSGGFNIWTHNRVPISPGIQAHIDEALARWEGVIAGNTSSGSVPTSVCGGLGADAAGLPVDDLLIIMDPYFDAEGGVLASAGVCAIQSGLPYVGVVRFDLADANIHVGTSVLTDILLHEIAHALGVGTLWSINGFLQNPACRSSCDANRDPPPSYSGPQGVDAYHDLGGTGNVPVENDNGFGSADSHWELDEFERELMTRFIFTSGGANPLSRVTVASLIDLGWPGVNLSAADPYDLGGPGLVAPQEAPVALHEEMYRGPIHILHPDGSFEVLPGQGR